MFNTKLQWEGFPGVFKSEGVRSDHFSEKSYIQTKKNTTYKILNGGEGTEREIMSVSLQSNIML